MDYELASRDSKDKNPLEQPLPEDPIARVHRLARDLAYGAVHNMWNAQIITTNGWADGIPRYLRLWGGKHPNVYLLSSFAYLSKQGPGEYILTEKAFALLERPAITPSVFISYRRSESSAFGLLVEARLKMAGVQNPFLDKNLVPGDEWIQLLEQCIRQCQFFILLVGPITLESAYVQQEITWAMQSGANIIPIWHNGFSGAQNYPIELETKNAIRVKEESAEEYELAIIRLLSRLGYSA